MRIILGIGNPGNRYKINRHNVGFLFLDFFAGKKSLDFVPSKGDYDKSGGAIGDKTFLLIKPTTFVNNIGIAAEQIKIEYNLALEDLLVVCDDINLNLGTLRVRLSGGDGGHNGLVSIIYNLNSNNFPRIRIGVGPSLGGSDLAKYVLSDFNSEEIAPLTKVFEKSASLVEEFITGGSKAMLDLNSTLNPS